MTGAEKTAAEFTAIVRGVLASMEPPPVIRPEDVASVVAELVERLMTFYPRQRGGLIGLRAIVDEHGLDSWYGMRAVRAYEMAMVASRLARLRSDGHAPQAEALLRDFLGVAARRGYAPAA